MTARSCCGQDGSDSLRVIRQSDLSTGNMHCLATECRDFLCSPIDSSLCTGKFMQYHQNLHSMGLVKDICACQSQVADASNQGPSSDHNDHCCTAPLETHQEKEQLETSNHLTDWRRLTSMESAESLTTPFAGTVSESLLDTAGACCTTHAPPHQCRQSGALTTGAKTMFCARH